MNALPRNSTEKMKIASGKTVHVPKCITTFDPWLGKPVKKTYGGKALLALNGKPLFAELVVLRMLEKDGWRGLGRFLRPELPSGNVKKPVELPLAQQDFLNRIREKAGCRGGCFDVFAWRGKRHRFIELKRSRKDRIRETQKRWLSAAIRCGIKMHDLLIVEWGFGEGR